MHRNKNLEIFLYSSLCKTGLVVRLLGLLANVSFDLANDFFGVKISDLGA